MVRLLRNLRSPVKGLPSGGGFWMSEHRKIIRGRSKLWLAAMLLALATGCLGRTFLPEPFESPLESRLILQMPYYSFEGGDGGPAALASVLTYNGRPTTVEEAAEIVTASSPSPVDLAVMARRAGLSAEMLNGTPEMLLEAVRQGRPLIIRLGAPAPPLAAKDYAVVVGYTPDGPVLNSKSINQQIVPWREFLAGWHKAGNLIIKIENL